MSAPERAFAHIVFDGERLSADPHAHGRRLRVDARCLRGEPVPHAYAHVCALPDRAARLRFDEPEVQQTRRDALAHWIPLARRRAGLPEHLRHRREPVRRSDHGRAQE